MPSTTEQMQIDGKWTDCLSAEGYGLLGVRQLCELKSEDGHPPKKLLLRYLLWAQPGAGRQPARLRVQPLPAGHALSLRPVAGKQYNHRQPGPDGLPTFERCGVLQQDVTGLMTLKGAILQACRKGDYPQIWKLFYAACKALDAYGRAAGKGGTVSLQHPNSLAVGPDNRVVLLDAELGIEGAFAAAPEAQKNFTSWFGPAGGGGVAPSQEASLMHANALLLYFRQVLAGSPPEPAGGQNLVRIKTQLGQTRQGMDLDALEDWVRETAGTWDIVLDDEEVDVERVAAAPAGFPAAAATAMPPGPARPRKGSLLLRASLWLNLILIILVIVLWLLRPSGGGGLFGSHAAEAPAGQLFSSYCVVLPTQGTIANKVRASLEDLFPRDAAEVKPGDSERERRLSQKLEEAVKSLKDPEKLKELLSRLASNHSIRFKGFGAGEGGENLRAIIERGGIYSLAGSGREEYGSLLETDSLAKILDKAGKDGQGDARSLLADLRRAVAEYASLLDALTRISHQGYCAGLSFLA